MNLMNCLRIVRKDWKESVKNKDIIIPMFILPVIFTIIMPIIILYGILIDPESFINEFGDKKELMNLLNISEQHNDYLVAAIISTRILILPYFLFIPCFTSIIMAADSFAGEKERKTMESLALLPITKTELIIGKVLAAFLPAMGLTIIFFGVQGVIINVMFLEYLDGNILIFTELPWILTVFIFSPSLAFLNILITVIISSGVKSFKNAQSIAGLLVTPVLVLFFAQIFNPALLLPEMVLLLSCIFGILSLLFIYLGSKLLDIEKLILMI